MTLKAIKTRIYPNLQQQYKIVNNFGCCRFVWNMLLDMQIERYNNGGKFGTPYKFREFINCPERIIYEIIKDKVNNF